VSRNFTDQIKRAKIDLRSLSARPPARRNNPGLPGPAGRTYTGSGVTPSAICIDKVITKMLFERVGIPTPPYHVIEAGADRSRGRSHGGEAVRLPDDRQARAEGSSVGIRVLEAGAERSSAASVCAGVRRHLLEQFVPAWVATVGVLVDDAAARSGTRAEATGVLRHGGQVYARRDRVRIAGAA